MARRSFFSAYLNNWTKRSPKARILQAGIALFALLAFACLALLAYTLLFIAPNLPSLDTLTDYRPKIPLRVYTADNVLIGEFGEERRDFVPIAKIPEIMKNAVIAIEDDSFYEHGGVNFVGFVRASIANLRSSRSQGASTITMQVARTFLLTRQKTYTRKIQEILLAFEIENQLSKDQILELYMNQIYLGERAYGFGSAARIYFGKPIKDLTVAEAAMLAGLPKAPATANPVVNPKRAKERQQHILKRMRELGFISPGQYAQAAQQKLIIQGEGRRFLTHAEHAAETARQLVYAQYKEATYTSGFNVYTTLNSADQNAAYAALRRGVMDYERRHGYRGPEAFIDLPGNEDERAQAIGEALLKHPDSGDLQAAIVVSASSKLVRAEMLSGEAVEIAGDGLRFASSGLSSKAKAQDRIKPGAVIRVTLGAKKKWAITQLPEVAAAFIALNAREGSIRALVGGFDFALNQFDHVNQAWRQPGSTIKPFIYSAALEKGFSPSTMINDEPLAETVSDNGGKSWNPGNDDGRYDGPVTMRTGLKKSKNLVSIRILRSVTPSYAQDYITRFGFDADKHPANLTMTLGTGSVTPFQMAGAYAVFANGGYQVAPYLIQKIVDGRGSVIWEHQSADADREAARVLDPRNAFLMDSMMRDVVRSGTGYMAGQKLARGDLAGKTGTTDNALDGWFAGYSGDIVGVAWMGYDNPKSLGNREFGGTLALPIWIDYMRVALRGTPEMERTMPEGMAQVEGDFMYQEYVAASGRMNENSVRSVDVEQQPRNFWERLFGGQPQQRPRHDESEEQRQREMYGG